MFWEVAKVLGLTLLAVFAFKIAKQYKKQMELQKQGVVFSSWFPIFTDTLRVIYYATKYPFELVFVKMVQEVHGYGGKEIPAKVGMYFMGMPIILFNESDALDELYVTKNAYFTKHEITRSN